MKQKTKTSKVKEVYCKHAKKELAMAEDVYIYNVNEQDFILCNVCNCLLASEVLKQIGLEVFMKRCFE